MADDSKHCTIQPTLDALVTSKVDNLCDDLLNHDVTKEVLSTQDKKEYVTYGGRVYPGLINTISKRFYPDYVRPARQYGTSSINKGIMVHRQIYHMIECIKRPAAECKCDVKTNPNRLNDMTKNALRKFEEIHFTPVAAEVPILCKSWNVGTRLDVIGYLHNDTSQKASCIISIKTGYSSGRNRNIYREYMKDPLNKVKSTEQNHNQLQALTEHCILRFEYGFVFKKYYIIYLAKNYEDVEVEEPADWWGDNKFKKQVFDALTK